ncbi:hypothetical protein BCV70DRAFT_200381 [Testicularia cyperi]|uniref:Uncharacterized protein n=1 Tax=Testicularia cyperi TaxID=1882483 RepID=A0A317XSA3_9BASI|nr:hypothetical protein BCV70DRAFT_200381 [Testicularia cyperi]
MAATTRLASGTLSSFGRSRPSTISPRQFSRHLGSACPTRSPALARVRASRSILGSVPLPPSRFFGIFSAMVSALPTEAELRPLAAKVKKQFDVAIAEGDAFFYPSEAITLQESTDTGVLWQIRTVPALLKKPKANASSEVDGKAEDSTKDEKEDSKPKKAEQNKSDVFAPPYVPNLLVEELDDHIVLLNKFCVVPQHFLMVTREFESQDLPPSPRTLALAYRIASSHRSESTELLAFYNCGQVSGASQPHRHLQFVQCPPLDTVGGGGGRGQEEGKGISEEDRDRILDSPTKIPVESLLDRIERDGKEEDAIHALPLPYQHFVSLLAPPPAIKKNDQELEKYIGNKFMGLLDAMFRARMFGDAKSKAGRPSFNILLSKRALHVIPRSQEEFEGLPHDQAGKVGNLSINSLGYAGFMLTRSLEEQSELAKLEGGVEKVLATTGVAPVEDVTIQAGLPTHHV